MIRCLLKKPSLPVMIAALPRVTPSVDPYTVDNCAGYSITYRWAAVDTCGNTAEVTQSFNILPDNTPPTFDAALWQ